MRAFLLIYFGSEQEKYGQERLHGEGCLTTRVLPLEGHSVQHNVEQQMVVNDGTVGEARIESRRAPTE